MIDSRSVRNAFDRAASSYEQNSALHQDIGLRLINKILSFELDKARVLDIGIGTGRFSQKLSISRENWQVYGIDCSFQMLDIARRKNCLQVLQADAGRLCFKPQTFDLVTSNLAFQWLDDLSDAFKQTGGLLKQEGRLYFTCFCSNTLFQLRQAAELALGVKFYHQLPESDEIDCSLKAAGFSKIESEVFNRQIGFADIFSLLKWIKSIGSSRIGRAEFLTKGDLFKLGEFYTRNLSSCGPGLTANFEIIQVCARK